MALTDKQECFVREYLVDMNATQAYIRAGYKSKGKSAENNASRLMGNDRVRARINELQGKRAEKLELDAQWVLDKLVKVSEMSMQEKPVEKWDPSQKKMIHTGEYVYDSNGANKALELIGKHLGMFKDKLELTGELVVFKGEESLTD